MKASRKESFTPVVLTLETQAEVDAVFAFFNHNEIATAANLPYECYQVLEPFHSSAADDIHSKFQDLIKKRKA